MMDRITLFADRALLGVAALALVAMMLHINLDVVAGLVFNAPIPLTSAIVTEYYMLAVALLPLAAGELRGAHTSVDLFVTRLPAAPRAALDILVRILSTLLFFVLASQAWQQAAEKYGSNAYVLEQMSRVVVWPAYFIAPLGLGAMGLLIGVKLVCCLLGRREPSA